MVLAGYRLYDEAIDCLELIRSRNVAVFTPACCDAATSFYRQADAGLPSGVIVLAEGPDGAIEPYQAADIIVAVNDTLVSSDTVFSDFLDRTTGGYTAYVLRANQKGTLDFLTLDISERHSFYFISLMLTADVD